MTSKHPSPSSRVETVIRTMDEFAANTGLHPSAVHPCRYLWTDAFAVCNFLGLWAATGDGVWLDRAKQLVDQVHDHLGRFRADDPDPSRRGTCLSGSPAHPTAAGLRIGKRLAERREHEPFDERLEWERDGQYFHYLTKWMHALAQLTQMTGEDRYAYWAQETARGIHPAFAAAGGAEGKRMYWKMSVDLSRPLVSAMGHHDPLDGFITLTYLAAVLPPPRGLDLRTETQDLYAMLEGQDFATDDPLGLGGLLCDAHRLLQLATHTGSKSLRRLLVEMLKAAAHGLASYAQTYAGHVPPDHRLAFREFGLSLGLHAAAMMADFLRDSVDELGHERQLLASIMQHHPIGQEIQAFWSNPRHQTVSTWREHRDINSVMWATSLMPEGFLDLHL